MDLGRTAARGAGVTISIQLVRFFIQFLGLVLLGRLVSPNDFGLLVMVTAIIGIGEVLRDFGLMAAAVQAKTLSKGQSNNLFWLNSLIGLILGSLCLLAAPLISHIYDDERLAPITMILSITFLLSGVQTQFQAQITRSLRFITLSLSDLSAQVVAVAVATLMALNGYGYWALVAQLVCYPLVLLLLRASLSQWRPGFPQRDAPIRGLLKYGSQLMLTQTMVYASSNVDSVIVGARFGPAQLGIYNRAFQVLMMPLNQIFAPATSVALPILSKLQDEQKKYLKFLLRAQVVIAYPSAFLFVVVAVSAAPLFETVFGHQWVSAAPVFQLLAVGGFFQALGYVGYWVFLSLGLTGSHFKYSVVSRIVVVGLTLIGSAFGPLGVAGGYSLGLVIGWPLSLLWLRRAAGIEVRGLFLLGFRIVLVGLAATAGGIFVAHVTPTSQSAALIALTTLGCAVAGVIPLLTVPVLRRDAHAIWDTAKLLRKPQQHKSMKRTLETK